MRRRPEKMQECWHYATLAIECSHGERLLVLQSVKGNVSMAAREVEREHRVGRYVEDREK